MAIIKSDSRGVERIEGEANDCTVRALANAAAMPYKLAHKVLRKAGRQPRTGVKSSNWHPAYLRMGFRLVSIHGSTQGARFLSLMTNQAAEPGLTLINALPRLQQGRYVVKIRGHVLAVVDGKVLDYGYNSAGSRVQAIYKLDQQAVIFDK